MQGNTEFDQFGPRDRQVMSALSMTSMILGIVSFVVACCGLLGIPVPIAAIICGHLGVKDCNDNPEKVGKGLAIAGLILGYLAIFLLVGFYLWATTMDPEDMENLMKPLMEKLQGMGGSEVTIPNPDGSDLPVVEQL